MATHSVNVLIKARDEASKKFGRIGLTSKVMGTALKSTARSIRWSFTRAFAGISASARLAFSGITAMARRALNTIRTTMKRIAQGIAAAFAYSTYAAMKQQAAEIELASALKMAGTYSDALMEKLKQQASEIQQNSVYGDEYVLTLMRMAKTLGWTEDKLADAAKAAIALHAGFGGGRGKPEIFLRYYTDAINGTAKSLDTYIGELRTAKTEEERQIILQKNIARGWDVVKSKTEHAGGALKQMWNAIGDAAERFGKPFLDDITRTAKAIKKWSEDNQDAIARFAEKVHSYMTVVKDIFKAYIDFMKQDWKEGFSKSLDSTIVMIKAWGQSLMVVFKKIFMDIGASIRTWISNAMKLREIRQSTYRVLMEEAGYWMSDSGVFVSGGPTGGPGKPAKPHLFYKQLEKDKKKYWEEAGRLLSEGIDEGRFEDQMKKPSGLGTWGKVGEKVAAINREALDKIKDIMPEFAKDVEKAFAEHGRRLQDLKKPAPAMAPGEFPKPDEPDKDEPKTAFGMLVQKLQAREARFLTAQPGAKYDYDRQTAKNTNRGVSQRDRLIELAKSTKETIKTAFQPSPDKGANITVSAQAGQSPSGGANEIERYAKSTQQNTGRSTKHLGRIEKLLDEMNFRQNRGGVSLQPANFS